MRRAAVALAGSALFAACAGPGPFPAPPASHPASPEAPATPVPARPDWIALPDPDADPAEEGTPAPPAMLPDGGGGR